MADGSIRGVIFEPAGGSGGEDAKKQAQRDKLLEAVLGAGVRFWRDADGTAFATVPGEGNKLARYRVRSRAFALVVRGIFGQRHPRTVGSGTVIPGSVSDTAMAEALPALEAMALMGPVHAPDVRVIVHAGAVWLDLGADDWRAVRVDANGWGAVDGADVPLIRTEGVRPLPEPVRVPRDQALAALARLTNSEELAGEGAEAGAAARRRLMLFAAWLLGALHPAGPHAVLAVDGEQGSAKSTTCRVLRRLVDPNKADLRAPPRCEDSLVVAATSARVVALDNVSYIEADTADALCRLATGGGLSKRRLYTDGEEHLVSVARPVLLNGIPSLLARGDLADRALPVTLPPIPDHMRRPEAEVWADFEAAAPGILALLLDALAKGLHDLRTVQLSRLPRMADFARLVCAAAPAFGWTPQAMLDALEGNRADAIEAVIESDPVAVAVRVIAEERERDRLPSWTGTASELLPLMNACSSLDQLRERTWPKDAARLSARLRRVAPALRRAGTELVLPTGGGRAGRTITIKLQERAEQRSERSQRSGPSGSSTYGNAAERSQQSGNAGSVPPNPGSVPERSAGSEQDQELSSSRNAGNAGNAAGPTLGGGGYL